MFSDNRLACECFWYSMCNDVLLSKVRVGEQSQKQSFHSTFALLYM